MKIYNLSLLHYTLYLILILQCALMIISSGITLPTSKSFVEGSLLPTKTKLKKPTSLISPSLKKMAKLPFVKFSSISSQKDSQSTTDHSIYPNTISSYSPIPIAKFLLMHLTTNKFNFGQWRKTVSIIKILNHKNLKRWVLKMNKSQFSRYHKCIIFKYQGILVNIVSGKFNKSRNLMWETFSNSPNKYVLMKFSILNTSNPVIIM